MNVLFLSPGFPVEMPQFVRGLVAVGATVHGVGEQPEALLPRQLLDALAGYLQVRSLWDEKSVIAAVGWSGNDPPPS